MRQAYRYLGIRRKRLGLGMLGHISAATPTFAAAIPGVCRLFRDGAIGRSKAGQEATIHMQKLTNEIGTELAV